MLETGYHKMCASLQSPDIARTSTPISDKIASVKRADILLFALVAYKKFYGNTRGSIVVTWKTFSFEPCYKMAVQDDFGS